MGGKVEVSVLDVPGVALAAHGEGLVPEVVVEAADAGEVGHAGVVPVERVSALLVLGQLLDGLARAVSGAVIRARRALARRAVVAREALAEAGLALAQALVGALHLWGEGM